MEPRVQAHSQVMYPGARRLREVSISHVIDVVAELMLLISQWLFHQVTLCSHGMWDAVCRLCGRPSALSKHSFALAI